MNPHVQAIFRAARISELKRIAGIVKPRARIETDQEKARRLGWTPEILNRFRKVLRAEIEAAAAARLHACDEVEGAADSERDPRGG